MHSVARAFSLNPLLAEGQARGQALLITSANLRRTNGVNVNVNVNTTDAAQDTHTLLDPIQDTEECVSEHATYRRLGFFSY